MINAALVSGLDYGVTMTATIVLASISGIVAVVSVVLSSYAAVRSIRIQNELEMRRQQVSRTESIEEIMSKYRNPLLRSTNDLQGRIQSIIKTDFMKRHLSSEDAEQREYARTSTLFRLAEYFGWVEILRRGVQFLDLGDQERSQKLEALLEEIRFAFANTHRFPSAAFRLFRDEQRAIGELVLESLTSDPRGYQCMGYAQFVNKLEVEPNFARWFKRLSGEMSPLSDPPPGYLDRLIDLNDTLKSLLDFLDPGGIRYSTAGVTLTRAGSDATND